MEQVKKAYPVIMGEGEKYIVVSIPDFNIGTQGADYAEAMEMARDAIGLMGITLQDEKKPLPEPSDISMIQKEEPSDVITLVDVDFAEYRKKNDRRSVRRNVTLPAWLDDAAEKSGLNVSAVLQAALKKELNLAENV